MDHHPASVCFSQRGLPFRWPWRTIVVSLTLSPQKSQQLAPDIFSSLNQSKGNYKSIQILRETNSLRDAVPYIRQFQSNVEGGRTVVASRQSRGRRN
ncbi:unnamed protein product [Camellia sinensis]